MTNISDRIKQLTELEKISIRHLEQTIACSNGVLSRCIQKNTDISSVWVSKIIEIFPEINAEWLLTGKGEIKKEKTYYINESPNILNDSKQEYNRTGIPLIPINAMAAFGNGDLSAFEYQCERFVVPTFKDAEFLIGVRGSSMYPKYSSGDIVACKKVPLDTFFQWNKVYVLDTEQGALIKRVKPGVDNEHILIVSDNKEYNPFELCICKIRSLAIVLGVIRLGS